MDKKALLEWYIEAGVDEATMDEPVDHFAAPAKSPSFSLTEESRAPGENPLLKAKDDGKMPAVISAPVKSTLHHTPSAAIAAARELADQSDTLESLEAAIRAFNGCAIKKTASKTVFGDGNTQARIMIIGEAPGAQEDIQGIPFCGPSGALLDKMLAAIGLDRTRVFISNTVFWRPPGNRQPSPEETAICLPLIEKLIALVNPALLILSGGTATSTLLRRDSSISRLRGKIYDYENPYLTRPVPTALMYHPSYLLRQPLQKRLAWDDLIMIRNYLNSSNISY